LTHAHDEEYFRHWAKKTTYFGAVEHAGEYVGFTLAVRTEDLEADQQEWTRLFAGSELPDHYIRLIAVRPEYRRKQVGYLLYEDMFRHLSGSMASMIIRTPYNEASVRFHERTGFVVTHVVEKPTNDWNSFCIYLRDG